LLATSKEAPVATKWEYPAMNESERTNRPEGWQGQGPDSIEARRRVLRSLGAGGAVAGLPSLAQATSTRPYCKKDNKNYNPTASAVGSMIGSMVGSTLPMYGHPCSYYTNSSNWGVWSNGKGRTLNWDLCARDWTGTRMRFFVAFELADPGSSSPKYNFCEDIIRGSPASDEAIWLTALFNANRVGTRFPYAPGGVIDLYKNSNPLTGGSTDSTLHAKAITLFRDYLSLGMPA
jgi:hypothetical protein